MIGRREKFLRRLNYYFIQKKNTTEEAFRKGEELNENLRIGLQVLKGKKIKYKFFDVHIKQEIDEKYLNDNLGENLSLGPYLSELDEKLSFLNTLG